MSMLRARFQAREDQERSIGKMPELLTVGYYP